MHTHLTLLFVVGFLLVVCFFFLLPLFFLSFGFTCTLRRVHRRPYRAVQEHFLTLCQRVVDRVQSEIAKKFTGYHFRNLAIVDRAEGNVFARRRARSAL